ncbi:hypothetical protein GCM10009787_28260 [Streptomyces bangladeshensis]|uniref:Uncharacterized protein n=1 Tax=Streptomyces bangladeshensis TaxID=295352 RepID=A0ABN3BHK3_9ACTN
MCTRPAGMRTGRAGAAAPVRSGGAGFPVTHTCRITGRTRTSSDAGWQGVDLRQGLGHVRGGFGNCRAGFAA